MANKKPVKKPETFREFLETTPEEQLPPGIRNLREGEDLSALNALLAKIRDQAKDKEKKK
jgi:hypothetical protein